MIYSTSNINIGGFLFVFENSMMKWFNDIKKGNDIYLVYQKLYTSSYFLNLIIFNLFLVLF